MEAKAVDEKIKQLKQRQAQQAKRLLQERHKEDLHTLDSTHENDLTDFQALWKQKLKEFLATCAQAEDELKLRQETEFKAEHERLEAEIPVIPKHPKAVPQLKKLQEALVRQKDYDAATEVQAQLDALSVDRSEEWLREKQAKVARQLELLKKRQETELANFKKKARAGQNELLRSKEKEREALVKHYRNNRQELLGVHKHELALVGTRKVTADPTSMTRLLSNRSAIIKRFSQDP